MGGFFLKLFGLFLGGGGTVTAIVEGLTKAHADALNATSEIEKIAAKDRIDRLNAALTDTQNARQSMKNQPFWMAMIAFMIGFPFAFHLFCVGIGTTLQPLILGGQFDWMLHIPKLPSPLDQSELGIIAFFYGYGALTISSNAVAKAVIGRRK